MGHESGLINVRRATAVLWWFGSMLPANAANARRAAGAAAYKKRCASLS